MSTAALPLPARKKLRPLQLVAVIFLTVSGGPYGLEPLLTYAGSNGAIVLLLITPLLWDIPSILTVMELNSMMPEEGGYYQWVKRALGLRFAFYEGWWTWLYTFVDLAIYPVLFVTYAGFFIPGLTAYKIPVCLGIIWGCAGLNILGIRPVGKFSLILGALVLLPFVLLFGTALLHPTGQPMRAALNLQDLPFPAIGMGLYTVMWNFIGWDNATTYAEEVDNPVRSYLKATAIAFVAILAVYLLAVLTARQSGIDPALLEAEGFPALGALVGGRWLGALIAAGGMASALGLFSAVLLSVSRIPKVMADDRLLPAVLNRLHRRFDTPYVSILVCALVVSLLVFWTFGELLIIDITIYGAGLFLEYIALIVLRWRVPGAVRPFRIPLNIPGLILMTAFPVAVYLMALLAAFGAEGGKALPALAALGALVSAEVVWQVVRAVRKEGAG